MSPDLNTRSAPSFASAQARLSVLVLEDSQSERELLVAALQSMGHAALGVANVSACHAAISSKPYDILVINLELPNADGLAMVTQIRTEYSDIGIIVLTNRARLDDRLAGYRSGADLYLTRPTSSAELGAAIRALSKRSGAGILSSAQLVLNTATLQLLGSGGAVDISDTEVSLLISFAKSSGQRLETAQMIETTGKTLSKSTLEVQMVRLRKKLEQAGAVAPTIKSIRGLGYQLCVPLEVRLPPLSTH